MEKFKEAVVELWEVELRRKGYRRSTIKEYLKRARRILSHIKVLSREEIDKIERENPPFIYGMKSFLNFLRRLSEIDEIKPQPPNLAVFEKEKTLYKAVRSLKSAKVFLDNGNSIEGSVQVFPTFIEVEVENGKKGEKRILIPMTRVLEIREI